MATFNTNSASRTPLSTKVKVLIITSVTAILVVVLLMLSGGGNGTKTQDSPLDLKTYTSDLYTFQYPKDWIKEGNALSLDVIPSTELKDDVYIKIERYSKVIPSVTPDTVERLEEYDLKGNKLKDVETSRSQDNNQNVVTVNRVTQDLRISKKYMFGAEYIWKITVSAPKDSEVYGSLDTIRDSFKVN